MTVINEQHTIAGHEITLSLLVWRRFRLPMPGYHEAVLTANRDLADKGQHIPVGTRVVLPIDTAEDRRIVDEVRLWDER
jgi:phage tail protein X